MEKSKMDKIRLTVFIAISFLLFKNIADVLPSACGFVE
jgi:hypothetical protein